MRTHRTIMPRTTIILALCLTGLASTATAQERAGSRLVTRLQSAARQANIPSYVRTCANGAKRCYLNPNGSQQLRAVERTLDNRANTLEITHIGSPQANHTLGIFNRQFVHVQFIQGTSNWRLRNWGGGQLRPSSSKLYSAVIQLTDAEANKVKQQLQRGFETQGPEMRAGRRWENGNLRGAYNRSFNCVSFFTEMPVGANGEPLWRVIGLPSSYNGNPRGLMRALETQANDRVAGICVYGPQVQGFPNNPNQDKFTF
jgi:hypothetical protein